MARRTFVLLQLRKSSCFGFSRVSWYFLVHIFKIKKPGSISSIGSWDIEKSLKISFASNFVSLRAFVQFRFPAYTIQTKKTHSIIFTRSWVLVYITLAHGRTDRQTFFEKVFFFLSDQEYIYVSIPISTISQISPPFWPKLVYLFSYGNGYENIKC